MRKTPHEYLVEHRLILYWIIYELNLLPHVMRAHGLYMFYFSPVCPVYNVLIGLPRFPKICVLSKVSDLPVTAR